MRLLSSFMVVALLATSAQALVIDTRLNNPAREEAAQQLFHELRCMVCEGQSLAESDALFAQQMRNEIRRRLENGDGADSVKDYFVERYGSAILQSPPLNAVTLLLWVMPVLSLFMAAWLMWPRRRGARA